MKFFGIGLGLGSLAGLGISLLPNPQTGHKVKDDVRLFLNDTKNDATSLATSTKQAKNAASQLISDLPQAEQSVKDIQNSLTNFQSSIKPEVDQMMENVSHLTEEAKTTVDGIKNEL
ncbi:YtxH domain-containing protein [Lactobacillus isalae]|uniref:YtxH domain-containing protein n=1 Tax=Lactobacillus isalae TaxID=2993455 RepID=UPI0024A84AC8|nr:YtxH domain-containing protein [Lactobacillus isalae]